MRVHGPLARLVTGVVSILIAASAMALDPSQGLTQYVQTVWRMEEGLPHNTVRAILQTRDGYLWLGTYGGLVRFDGVRFVVFDNRNTGLQDNEIRALAEDHDGVLWIGTSAGGLHRFVNGRIEPWDHGIGRRAINALACDEDGTLWVGTSGGLYSVRAGTATRIAALPETPVQSIAPARRVLWVGMDSGLFRLENDRAARIDVPSLTGTVRAVRPDIHGRLWVAGQNRVVVLKPVASGSALIVERTIDIPEVGAGWIHALLEDHDGNMWIGTYFAGLLRVTAAGRVDRISTAEGFLDHRPWALCEDREGSLWVGTRSGLARLRDGAATAITMHEGLPGNIVRTVMEDGDGSMWIGGDSGLTRLRNGSVSNYTARDGLPDSEVFSVLRDRGGRFWAGTQNGLAEIDTARGRVVRTITTREGKPLAAVRCLLEDRTGRVWVATTRGLMVADRGLGSSPLHIEPGLEDLATLDVQALHEDRRGRIWIGTMTDGMRIWDAGRVETPTLVAGAAIGVRSFHEDEDGTEYVGTMGSGLFVRRDGGPFGRVTTRVGMPDDSIWSILADGPYLWMSSDRGVFRIRRSAILDVIDGRAREVVVNRLIGTQDGMKSRECNGGGRPSGVIARDGRIWFPTGNGAVVIDPRRLGRNQLSPPVVIEEIVVDRRAVPSGETVAVPAGSRDVEIHYTGLSFVDPARVRFRYRLEGYDPAWIDAEGRRTAYFAHLPPGPYEFQVQAANNDGVWNETGARLTLRVLPRFYETWWFRTLAALLLITLGCGWFQFRTMRQRAREDELRRIVAERTAELQHVNVQLEQLASIDDLTGIANYRHFSAALEKEWARCQRSHEPLSLLLCDIDDFKAYNDTYGHPAGDLALRRVAQAMTGEIQRQTDLVARCGGEEFAVVLPSTDASGAQSLAERIRAAVRALSIEHAASRAGAFLTLSVGCVTVHPEPSTTNGARDLIAAADHALYAAKARGRDCVVVGPTA